jgi:arylsulfatase A-like enzyme
MMGYQTPNLDRLANEGGLFTDAYGEQSCTAGRGAFLMGQHPARTGLLTIGMPGSPHGIADWMPTIGDLLKPLGYRTGQFGKTTSGTRTSTCRQATASTSFSATSTTSMRRRSRRGTTTPRIRSSKIREFLAGWMDYHYQTGSSLNAGNISYQTLRMAEALKRLGQVEELAPPRN